MLGVCPANFRLLAFSLIIVDWTFVWSASFVQLWIDFDLLFLLLVLFSLIFATAIKLIHKWYDLAELFLISGSYNFVIVNNVVNNGYKMHAQSIVRLNVNSNVRNCSVNGHFVYKQRLANRLPDILTNVYIHYSLSLTQSAVTYL